MKNFMNFKFVVLCALALMTDSAVYGQDNVIDEVVWVVGDEAILKSEVEEARMSAAYEGRKFDGDPYCVIPEEIAVQKLFLHQAALDSIEVPESEVIQRVDYMTNMYIANIVRVKKWKNTSIRHPVRFVRLYVKMHAKV